MSTLDSAIRFERAVLGSLIEEPSLWPQADLNTDDFCLSDHQQIWQVFCRLHEDRDPVDIVTLMSALDGKVQAAYITSLLDGVVPLNFRSYVRQVREAAQERRFQRLHERLGEADRDQRPALVEEISNLLHGLNSHDWRTLFHTYAEIAEAPQPAWLITNFCELEDILCIAGPSGHGKSLLLASICRAVLSQKPLFNYSKFQVPNPAKRVLYLIPEVTLRSFRRRLEWFGLLPFVESGRLFIRTLSYGPVVRLTDPRLLEAAEGSDVILDTAIRFSEGDESSSSDNRDGLAAMLFGLSRAGARSVICAHHAPKDFAKQPELTLENCLRGSGDIGAMLSTAYGIRQVDRATNRIMIQCVKPRDLEPLAPFEVQGRPFISDVGDFRVISEPSEKSLAERLGDSEAQKARLLADELFAEGKGGNFVAEELKRRGLGKSRALVSRWQREFKEQQCAVSESVSKSVSPLRGRNTRNTPSGECAQLFEEHVRDSQVPAAFEKSGNTLTDLPIKDMRELRNTRKQLETLSETEASRA